MNDLIKRLETVTGPDRALDGEIWREVNGWPIEAGFEFGSGIWHRQDPKDLCAYEAPPLFTSSIDDAMTLVPEGWLWTVATYWCDGSAKPPYFADCAPSALRDGSDVEVSQAWAAIPALALCIAALKARAV
jgi:hypothetical protein